MKIHPETILALVIVAAGAIFYSIRWQWRRDKRKTQAAQSKAQKAAQQEKDKALDKFKEIHAKARDQREKLSKEIDNDPEGAARALRNMLKR